MPPTKVGIREFREKLASYLESRKPVAITRHGETIGVYLPLPDAPTPEQLEKLRIAAEVVQDPLAAAEITEEQMLDAFERTRGRDLKPNATLPVTAGGEQVGVYMALKPKPTQQQLDALAAAGERMQQLLAEAGVTEEELIEEFDKARKAHRLVHAGR